MSQVLNPSDIEVILSDEESSSVIRSPAQASPPTRARPAPDRADRSRFADETYKRCGRPNCHCSDGPGHGPKRYLSTIARTGERPRLGYVPNADYAQVAEFLANFRKLQEMLNEICAINAELLRRRESLD